MDSDEQYTEIREAECRAGEILHFAILQFVAMEESLMKESNDGDRRNRLLGMQSALLRQSARLYQIQKKFGATATLDQYMNLARAIYTDVAQYQPKNPPTKRPKARRLKVVK